MVWVVPYYLEVSEEPVRLGGSQPRVGKSEEEIRSRGRPVRGARAEPGRGAVPVRAPQGLRVAAAPRDPLRDRRRHVSRGTHSPLRLHHREFDGDHNGTMDLEEFRSGMKQVLLAITNALVSSPIQMVIDDDDQSILKAAEDYKSSKVEQQRP
ncbi:hypothetical protein Scep_003662 [Stephania cephalantha]|uniref:EF-hand domain-containing protein n=1 Tax=Stephania cephalantha TaxID=152367 RepID=A0AAP0PUN8_9MAGN